MRVLPLLLLSGCVSSGGLVKPSCVDTTTIVGESEITPLGFSAAGLVERVGVATRQTLSWIRPVGETTLTTEVLGRPGQVRFIDSEVEEGSTGDSDDCGDRLETEVELAFSTEDGAFADTWAVTLLAETVDAASFTLDLDAVSLAGTFDAWAVSDPATDYESLGAGVVATLAPGGGRGEVTLEGAGWEDPECQEDGCVAWESQEMAASWGEESLPR
jgi:hypothetical protein